MAFGAPGTYGAGFYQPYSGLQSSTAPATFALSPALAAASLPPSKPASSTVAAQPAPTSSSAFSPSGSIALSAFRPPQTARPITPQPQLSATYGGAPISPNLRIVGAPTESAGSYYANFNALNAAAQGAPGAAVSTLNALNAANQPVGTISVNVNGTPQTFAFQGLKYVNGQPQLNGQPLNYTVTGNSVQFFIGNQQIPGQQVQGTITKPTVVSAPPYATSQQLDAFARQNNLYDSSGNPIKLTAGQVLLVLPQNFPNPETATYGFSQEQAREYAQAVQQYVQKAQASGQLGYEASQAGTASASTAVPTWYKIIAGSTNPNDQALVQQLNALGVNFAYSGIQQQVSQPLPTFSISTSGQPILNKVLPGIPQERLSPSSSSFSLPLFLSHTANLTGNQFLESVFSPENLQSSYNAVLNPNNPSSVNRLGIPNFIKAYGNFVNPFIVPLQTTLQSISTPYTSSSNPFISYPAQFGAGVGTGVLLLPQLPEILYNLATNPSQGISGTVQSIETNPVKFAGTLVGMGSASDIGGEALRSTDAQIGAYGESGLSTLGSRASLATNAARLGISPEELALGNPEAFLPRTFIVKAPNSDEVFYETRDPITGQPLRMYAGTTQEMQTLADLANQIKHSTQFGEQPGTFIHTTPETALGKETFYVEEFPELSKGFRSNFPRPLYGAPSKLELDANGNPVNVAQAYGGYVGLGKGYSETLGERTIGSQYGGIISRVKPNDVLTPQQFDKISGYNYAALRDMASRQQYINDYYAYARSQGKFVFAPENVFLPKGETQLVAPPLSVFEPTGEGFKVFSFQPNEGAFTGVPLLQNIFPTVKTGFFREAQPLPTLLTSEQLAAAAPSLNPTLLAPSKYSSVVYDPITGDAYMIAQTSAATQINGVPAQAYLTSQNSASSLQSAYENYVRNLYLSELPSSVKSSLLSTSPSSAVSPSLSTSLSLASSPASSAISASPSPYLGSSPSPYLSSSPYYYPVSSVSPSPYSSSSYYSFSAANPEYAALLGPLLAEQKGKQRFITILPNPAYSARYLPSITSSLLNLRSNNVNVNPASPTFGIGLRPLPSQLSPESRRRIALEEIPQEAFA